MTKFWVMHKGILVGLNGHLILQDGVGCNDKKCPKNYDGETSSSERGKAWKSRIRQRLQLRHMGYVWEFG